MTENKFHDCFECGGKCCKFFSVPEEYHETIYTDGVPLVFYTIGPGHDPRDYFELHEGIRINGDGTHFIAGEEVETRIKDTRLGRQLIVYSRCSKLDGDGQCVIYDDRPETCRIFDEKTVEFYNVPSGCIYDPGEYGEDFGV